LVGSTVLAVVAGALLLLVDGDDQRAGKAATTRTSSETAGQIEGGDIFRARVGGSAFADRVRTSCGSLVEMQVRVSNPGPGRLDDVRVIAPVPSGLADVVVVEARVFGSNANPPSTADDATVEFEEPAGLSYVPGTTVLLGRGGGFLRRLPDTIHRMGVDIGAVDVPLSSVRFVRFATRTTC